MSDHSGSDPSSAQQQGFETCPSLSVHFECLSEKTTIIREVTLPPAVTTVLQIKQHLEDEYNVPVCMQTVRYGSVVLNEDTSIKSLRLRAGDELHMSYYATAECKKLLSVLRWLEATLSNVRGNVRDERNQEPYGYYHPLDRLADLFMPSAELANKDYFIAQGGLKLLMELYGCLLKYEWENMADQWRYLEDRILLALRRLSRYTLSHGQLILKEDGLRMCLATLTRVSISTARRDLAIGVLTR